MKSSFAVENQSQTVDRELGGREGGDGQHQCVPRKQINKMGLLVLGVSGKTVKLEDRRVWEQASSFRNIANDQALKESSAQTRVTVAE